MVDLRFHHGIPNFGLNYRRKEGFGWNLQPCPPNVFPLIYSEMTSNATLEDVITSTECRIRTFIENYYKGQTPIFCSDKNVWLMTKI